MGDNSGLPKKKFILVVITRIMILDDGPSRLEKGERRSPLHIWDGQIEDLGVPLALNNSSDDEASAPVIIKAGSD